MIDNRHISVDCDPPELIVHSSFPDAFLNVRSDPKTQIP